MQTRSRRLSSTRNVCEQTKNSLTSLKSSVWFRGCSRRNGGSPGLKWELKAKPGLKMSGDMVSRSASIFTVGTGGTTAGLGEEQTGQHYFFITASFLLSERAPGDLSAPSIPPRTGVTKTKRAAVPGSGVGFRDRSSFLLKSQMWMWNAEEQKSRSTAASLIHN